MSDFDLPKEFVDTMRGAMEADRITLPFYAPTVWWRNGEKRNKALGGVQYFGGWAISAEEMDEAPIAPTGFVQETWTNREGGDYGVYAGRSFGFAVIAKRFQWKQNDAGNWRSHLQVLGYMATMDRATKKYTPWGPVVLSAKGYAGNAIETALKAWENTTREARREHAKNLPAWFFYAPIGTFGDEPNFVQVGKTGAQSAITPCSVWLPEKITVERLKAWYVGPDIAAVMASHKEEAAEWLHAWDKGKTNGNGSGEDDQFVYGDNVTPEDEIQF